MSMGCAEAVVGASDAGPFGDGPLTGSSGQAESSGFSSGPSRDAQAGQCRPAFEACNGIDDDCDGSVDEADACPCIQSASGRKILLACGAPAVATSPEYARPRTWPDARRLCQSAGGELAVADSIEVNDERASLLQGHGIGDAWIGLNDRQSEGVWIWLDTDPLGFENWAPNEPANASDNHDCAVLLTSNGLAPFWGARSCDSENNFICEIR